MAHDYGERECLECGKKFQPERAWTVTCSKTCNVNREKRLKKASKRAFYHKRKREYKEMQEKLVESMEHIKFLEEELERVKKAKVLPELQHCERLSLKAIQLPCGQRHECFKPKRCAKCPDGANENEAFNPDKISRYLDFRG